VLLAIRWPKHIAPGRDVARPVSLIDLAPTFLAAAGLKSHDDPNGQNLLPGIAPGSDDSKLRPWVLIGRELHAHTSRKDNLPYPVRAIRTTDHLYIINFKPDRWPSGNPRTIPSGKIPSFDQLANNTYAAFPDIDASPTKAWMVEHRNDENVVPLLDFAWNKRPAEELYDLRKDPFQMNNLAGNPEYEPVRKKLRTELMGELKANKDPRLTNDAFDHEPYLSKKTRRKNSKSQKPKGGKL
jgi:N-sulfoglucosamine sulfohydrolase